MLKLFFISLLLVFTKYNKHNQKSYCYTLQYTVGMGLGGGIFRLLTGQIQKGFRVCYSSSDQACDLQNSPSSVGSCLQIHRNA